MRENRYTCRYILANGRPRAFVAFAYNRLDASAAIERQAREELGADFAGARCEGTELAQRARKILIIAADAAGRPAKILREIVGDRILDA
jgi:hypothetical protein